VDLEDIQLVYEEMRIVNEEDFVGVVYTLIELLRKQEVVIGELVFLDLNLEKGWEAFVWELCDFEDLDHWLVDRQKRIVEIVDRVVGFGGEDILVHEHAFDDLGWTAVDREVDYRHREIVGDEVL
jgi:hypothetical protein